MRVQRKKTQLQYSLFASVLKEQLKDHVVPWDTSCFLCHQVFITHHMILSPQHFSGAEQSFSRESLHPLLSEKVDGRCTTSIFQLACYMCMFGNLLRLVPKNKVEWESIPMSRTYSSDLTYSFIGNSLRILQAIFRIQQHTQAWLTNEFCLLLLKLL